MKSVKPRGKPCTQECRWVCGVVLGALVVLSTRLSAQQPAHSTMPDSVRQYVSAAMTAFRIHSVHQAAVDWHALEDSVIVHAAGAQTPAGTWLPLTSALRSVDPHSFLIPPAGALTGMFGGKLQAQQSTSHSPHSRLVDGSIGVVVVPPHSGPNRPAYVDSLHDQIAALDGAGVCGWVVDLRDNTGGNMWPMLSGVGPLLGAEVVGSFTNSAPDVEWRYRGGRSWDGDSTYREASGWGTAPPDPLANPNAPVALLIGHRTASSGEMTLLAFLGRPNVRTFGDSTAGYTSSNTNVTLRDGATLIVTSGYPRDRLGRRYSLNIAPDVLVPSDASTDEDATLARAVAWLRQQPGCSGE